MAEATVAFGLGLEMVTSVLDIDLVGSETILTGDIDAVVLAGTTARLRGNCRLLNNLHVRGTLVADPTGVNLDGQGLWDIHTHDGGVLNLVGTEKTAWLRWGDSPVGWAVGDRLAVSPTASNVYTPSETTWQGTWAATTRPANAANVNLIDGSVARPEVVNLSQTLTIRNVTRIMMHESEGAPNVHTLKWLRVLNSGKTGELTFYPIHFHLLGDTCRGSLVEGVMVEGGKNHAFVPHGSHGISFPGCAAYNTAGVAFWWDLSTAQDDTNDSNDISWDDTLVMWSKSSPMPGESGRLSGYWLGSGQNVSANRTVATCVFGGAETSGFHWPEKGGRTSWGFHDCVGHNNSGNGLFVWQNALEIENHIDDFVAYRNGRFGIAHGAYINRYQYRGAVLSSNANGVQQKAKSSPEGPLLFEDILSNSTLNVAHHNAVVMFPTFFRRCTFTQVIYQEPSNGSFNRFEDCGLSPSDFVLTGAAPIRIAPESIIEVWETGVLAHRWASGVWS